MDAMPALGELRALGGQVLARRKPWAKLIEPQRFGAPPQTVADVNARLRRNLEEFQANYAVFLATVLAIALLFNPSSAVVVGLLTAGWAALLTHADVALVVRGRTITRTEQLGLAAAASLGACPGRRAARGRDACGDACGLCVRSRRATTLRPAPPLPRAARNAMQRFCASRRAQHHRGLR